MRNKPWALLPLLAMACTTAPFIWVDDYHAPQPRQQDAAYVISPGDLINIRVYGQDNISGRARVRSDGKVSMPFLNDVEAAGKTPARLGKELETRLHDFVNNAVVTVTLEEQRPQTVSVLGEVARPGLFPIEPGGGVLQALAAAGGLTEFAHRDRIFVLRGKTALRIRFTYRDLTSGAGKASAFRLELGDVVVVE